MNSVLKEIEASGFTTTPNGKQINVVYSATPPQEGRFMQELIRQCEPTLTLEVGLAYGISALYICDALEQWPDARHIVIEPFPEFWEGTGIHNLRKAGYESKVELLEMPSYQALPQLEKEGRKIDFAFIDGMHTFDYVLLDFFYIDKMLKVGGIVVLDDGNMPSIRKLCRFIATNLSYSVVVDPSQVDDKERFSRRILESALAVPVCPELKKKIFKIELVERDSSLGLRGRCIAFRKNEEDSRLWDHYVPF